MSIRIDREKCTGCGGCMEICPGNLINRDSGGKAFLKYPEECWGCASCLKECRYGAVVYYLGADIGGEGSLMRVRFDGPLCHWSIETPGKLPVTITVNRQESNQY